jgi:hypothetical protein
VAEQQLELDFTRAQQLAILRDCRLGGRPLAKLLLERLDDHIGRNRSWSLRIDELAEEAEISRSAAYKWLKWLHDEGLIGCDELPDGRRTFWICWGALWERTPEGQQQAERTAGPSPPGGPSVHHVDCQSTTWTVSPPGGLSVHHVDCQSTTWTAYKEERPLSAPLSAPSAPPSAPPSAAAEPASSEADLVAAVAAAGVHAAAEAVQQALRNGLAPAAIRELLAEYAVRRERYQNPEGWLYWRLTTPSAVHLAADQWPRPDHPAWRGRQEAATAVAARSAAAVADAAERQRLAERRQARERQLAACGAEIDQLTPPERADLVRDKGTWLVREVLRCGPRWRDVPLVRDALVEAFAARAGPAGGES